MAKLRVLVVDDSLTVRQRLCEALGTDPDVEVVGQATDGDQAIELCQTLRPDVVTLDMVLPTVSGLMVTESIMAHCPTPILIVSASLNRGELFSTYEALAAGAVDVLEKPHGDEAAGVWERKLVAAVRLVARIKVITHVRGRLGGLRAPSLPQTPPLSGGSPPAARTFRVVAIGASTGGPGALVEVFRCLPVAFPLPILVVMHLDEAFGHAFAAWIGTQTPLPVQYADGGERLATLGGRIVLAPPGRHLSVSAGRLHLTADPERHSCRPSIDVLFESLCGREGAAVAACLLTGMGRDGAAGLLALRNAGALTIAQDEASSVVYGMPREAVRLGAAGRVLPLAEIGPAIGTLACRGEERGC
jgi:two-component system chemotaxis response regulator CheB